MIVVTGLPDRGLDDRAASLGAMFLVKPPTRDAFAAFEGDARAYAERMG